MRWLLLLVFGASLAGVFFLLLRRAEEGAGGREDLVLVAPVGPGAPPERAPVRRPAGGGAPAVGAPEEPREEPREEPPADAAFEGEMRARYGALSVAALAQAFRRLQQEVGLQAMKVGQPLVQELGVDLGEVAGLAPDVLVYRGPDAERRMRAVVLTREEYPELTYKHREAVWLQREVSRRQQE